ncbi:MAG: glucose 1-dehydrogenase [Sphingomonas sp.]
MQGLLEGKVAVITGAGSGVGRAATTLFAQHGAKVIAADIDAAAAQATAAAVGAAVIGVGCDVADEASVTAAVARAVSAFGRLDIIYNNAGITASMGGGRMRTVLDMTQDDLDRVTAVNVNGVLFGCRAAIAQFETQGGGGVIVNTASIAGLIGFGGVAYGASKGAVVALTRTLAIEWAAKNIRVNAVCPAGMLTHFGGMDPDGANAEAMRKGMGARYPLGRTIEPIDCANAALFLASDLSSGITGVNLPVDAGLSAGPKF